MIRLSEQDIEARAARPSGPLTEFELHCNGDFAASSYGPRSEAWREIQHYAAQYAKDGPLKCYEVTRTEVSL